VDSTKHPFSRFAFLAALAGSCLSACRSVEFYEKAALSAPAMSLASPRCEVHWHQKVFYSHEGSAGGIGTVAGGGCGCY
jgi:hypothetical protein